MRFPARIAVCLLPFFMSACIHLPFFKSKQPPPPPIEPSLADTVPTAPPKLPGDKPPKVVLTPPPPPPPKTNTAAKPEEKPKPVRRRKNKPAQQTTNESPATNAANDNAANESAANAAPNPGVSAIGQLSSGESSELWRKTSDSIAATERGLNGINRQLTDSEQKTAEHIREFLKQARVALAAGDVDGASTLAAKAKVLLTELTE
jgi:outer membrane biosynthesis protein TonB